jgi:hypothetical protein
MATAADESLDDAVEDGGRAGQMLPATTSSAH